MESSDRLPRAVPDDESVLLRAEHVAPEDEHQSGGEMVRAAGMVSVGTVNAYILLGFPLVVLLSLLAYSLAKVSSKPTPHEPTPVDRFRDADGTDEWFWDSHGGSD
jgi:hypothetical protein